MKKFFFLLVTFFISVKFSFPKEEINFILEDFEENIEKRIKVAKDRECDFELSKEIIVSGEKSVKFKVYNKNINSARPPYFLIYPLITDWGKYNTLRFYILAIPERPVSSAGLLVQFHSTDFDWKTWVRGEKLYNFSLKIPTGKIVEISLPLDRLKFKNKVGEILFCIVEERGIYYIDKIELIQNRVEGVLVKEIANLQIDIPEFFAIDLYQKDAFYVLEKFYYNSKKPVILKIEFNIPTSDIKSKTISIYDEEKEILKKEVIFEKGEKLKEICFNIKGNKNLRVKVDDKELNMKIFDMKGLKEENLKIRKKRERTKNPFYRGIISAYAGTIYKKDDTVDIDAILSRIKELGVNCYTYLICYKSEKELKDLPEFLKKAKEEGIEVWVYIVPPSEAPIDRDKAIYERKYPPFDMDYLKWAEKIAEISLEYPNLTLWMIDDFDANLNFFTLDYTKKIYEKTKEINPKLLFGVCVYYDSIENFVKMGYLPYFDAILWGFQHSSIKFPDCGLKADSLSVEINDYYKLCPDKILIPCIYFTPHSSWPFGRPTREYLEKALEIAFNEAGICWIFTMPKPGTMQYEIVKNFTNRIELKKRKFE